MSATLPYLFSNFAVVWLTTVVTAGQTEIVLESGEGGLFPQPSGGTYFMAVLEDGRTGAREIVRVTGRSGDTLTVVRAQEDTTAQEFPAYSSISARLTAGALTALFAPKPIGIVATFIGNVASERVRFRLPYNTRFTADAAGCYGSAKAAATASTTYTIYRQPGGGGPAVEIATVVWGAGQTEAVVTIPDTVDADQGDWIEFVGPALTDTTLSTISITLAGTRT